MNILLLRGFNNYFNRIVKKYSTVDDYKANSSSFLELSNINFNYNVNLQENSNKILNYDINILKCENFPRTEHILINTKTKNAYFTNLEDAYNYMQQLEA